MYSGHSKKDDFDYEHYLKSDYEGFEKPYGYVEEIRKFKELYAIPKEQRKSKEYIELRDDLVIHNMKLAKWISDTYEFPILPEKEDREQMAYETLIKAVETYNPNFDFRFFTYAKRLIRWTFRHQFLANSRQSVYNDPNFEILLLVKKAFEDCYNELHREPDDIELARKMGITLDKAQELRRLSQVEEPLSIEEVLEELDRKERQDVIDEEYGRTDDRILAAERNMPFDPVNHAVVTKQMQDDVNNAIDQGVRFRNDGTILRFWYGTGDLEKLDAKSIAELLGTSHNTVAHKRKRAERDVKKALNPLGGKKYLEADLFDR